MLTRMGQTTNIIKWRVHSLFCKQMIHLSCLYTDVFYHLISVVDEPARRLHCLYRHPASKPTIILYEPAQLVSVLLKLRKEKRQNETPSIFSCDVEHWLDEVEALIISAVMDLINKRKLSWSPLLISLISPILNSFPHCFIVREASHHFPIFQFLPPLITNLNVKLNDKC